MNAFATVKLPWTPPAPRTEPGAARPTMSWHVDAATGRPVLRWVVRTAPPTGIAGDRGWFSEAVSGDA